MVYTTGIAAAIGLALTVATPAINQRAIPLTTDTCTAPVLRVQSQWTTDPPDAGCGPFSTLFVQSSQADTDVLFVVYQAGNTCDNSFHSVQGSGLVTVSGNIHQVTVTGNIPLSDGTTGSVNLSFTQTPDSEDKNMGNRTVSAVAQGTVILDGSDATGGVPTTNAQISRTKC
jgi:hypothetical protein